MSDEQKKGNRRFIGKIKVNAGKNGSQFFKVMMDNPDALNTDGTPNKYHKGVLLWYDAQTGLSYQVKQMSLWVPQEGMKPQEAEKGFTSHVTLDLDDKYQTNQIQ